MIHVCFGLHDADGRYSKFTGTTITSIFENTTAAVTAHILHDSTLTDDNRDKFSRLAQRYNQRMEFYNVETICAEKLKEYTDYVSTVKNSRVGVGAFYRLLLSQFISPEIEKIIYLDSDIIVNLDIAELWHIELGDKVLGVVPESFNGINAFERFDLCRDGLANPEDYFNSGVLLMNLKLFNQEEPNIIEGLKFRGNHPEYKFFDQEVLNYCFSTRTLKLPTKFNRFIECVNKDNETVVEKKIYHYAGGHIGLEGSDNFNRLWLKYFSRSMWCDEDVFSRLYEKFQTQDVEIKNLLINLTSALSGRKRAFVLFNEYVNPVKIIFNAQSEELFVIENFKDMPHLINTLKNLHNQRVFLSMLPNYPLLRDLLMAEGFVENKDFFDGMKFLSAAHISVDSYHLVKAM